MEEHLKALEGVVARLETLTGAKQDVSPSKVMMVMSEKMDDGIYPKSGKNGGVFYSSKKKWRKKCVNFDENFATNVSKS